MRKPRNIYPSEKDVKKGWNKCKARFGIVTCFNTKKKKGQAAA